MAQATSRRSRPRRAPGREAELPVIHHLPVTAVGARGEHTPPLAARLLVALPVLVVAAGIVCCLFLSLAAGICIALIGALVAFGSRRVGSPERLAASIGGHRTNAEADPRLFNLVEGICVAHGLPLPRVRVLDDAACNAILLGRSPRRCILILTSGLLAALDRMELEGVLAHELAHARRGDLQVAATATIGLGLLATVFPCTGAMRRLTGADREPIADAIAVRMTRYPPGLIAALKQVERADRTRPAGLGRTTARLTAGLWCAPLEESSGGVPAIGQLDLELRIAALREL